MKIYTKGGDAGETGLYGGARVAKDDLRIQTYGTIDELNAVLGIALTQSPPKQLQTEFLRLQYELFQAGTELATPSNKSSNTALIDDSHIQALEVSIDEMEKKLTPLKNFILPGGGVASSWTHLARTVCRRLERELTTLHRAQPVRPQLLQYFNRLSDYFFVAARFANKLENQEDIPWIPKRMK